MESMTKNYKDVNFTPINPLTKCEKYPNRISWITENNSKINMKMWRYKNKQDNFAENQQDQWPYSIR